MGVAKSMNKPVSGASLDVLEVLIQEGRFDEVLRAFKALLKENENSSGCSRSWSNDVGQRQTKGCRRTRCLCSSSGCANKQRPPKQIRRIRRHQSWSRPIAGLPFVRRLQPSVHEKKCCVRGQDRVAGGITPPSSHRTGQVLFTSGSSGRRVMTPVAGRVSTSPYPSTNISCAGAAMGWRRACHMSASETSPRSAKYALRSPRSTAGIWLNFHKELRPL